MRRLIPLGVKGAILVMSEVRGPKQFGVRDEPQTVTFSGNGKSKQYKISASAFILSGCVFSMFMIGYVGATGYLAFRDDLIASTVVRQARIKHEYEDRIAALRSKVDKITSRQLLDQQAVEAQVSTLIKQQEALTGRTGEFDGLMERAKKSGLNTSDLKIPTTFKHSNLDPMRTGSISTGGSISFASSLRGTQDQSARGQDRQVADYISPAKKLFSSVSAQMQAVQTAQIEKIHQLRLETKQKSDAIVKIFADLKVPLSSKIKQNIGGPYQAARIGLDFQDLSQDLRGSMDVLDTLRARTYVLPVGNPLAGSKISSSYGNRVDPFKKTSAFHSGIDFKARSGKRIKAAGAGKVVKAGRNGGYGLMVEIDHGNGITTRYAHLRRISVKVGQRIHRSSTIGQVGSTGRSTGPHLHFEVRRYGKSTNPMKFFNAGKKLNKFL